MQRMLLKSEERKANDDLFCSASMYLDPYFAREPIGSFKVCQRSTALGEHEGHAVTIVESGLFFVLKKDS